MTDTLVILKATLRHGKTVHFRALRRDTKRGQVKYYFPDGRKISFQVEEI